MKGTDRIRQLIAREAARLMYEEGIKEYRDAKRKAGKPFGSDKALSLGSHLPSNAEIHAELRALLELHEEEALPGRLLELRLRALGYLELFAPFAPYLVGSVLSGVVTEFSDIDLHLFADDPEEVENFLRAKEIPYETETVSIRKGGAFHDYTHIYIDDRGVTLECSVYPTAERHQVSKSSITGRPMERAGAKALRRLIGDMLPAQGNRS
jgi:predicted nucleotidyltransferase